MPTLEQRLEAIERQLALGTGSDLDFVSDRVLQLTHQVSRLSADKNIGNIVYGGPIQTVIATSVYTVGPFRQDLDATYSVEFDLWVPDNIIKLIRCQIRLKPGAVRSSVSVAASSGTLTSNSGGGSTSGGGAAHSHSLTSATAAGASHSHSIGGASDLQSGSTIGPANNVTDSTASPEPDTGHTHTMGSHTHSVNSHAHTLGAMTLSSESTHTHSLTGNTTANESTHTHTTPNHQHTINGHTHTLTLAIAEGGSSTGLHLWIDGVDRTTALGGPWAATTTENITEYLLDSVGRPVTGAHTIEITSTAIGSIEANFDFYVIAKPV